MNCDEIVKIMPDIVSGNLSTTTLAACNEHIVLCLDCSDTLRGAEALAVLQKRDGGEASPGLFDRISRALEAAPGKRRARQGFWLGTGFGGAIAASILALALTLGWISPVVDQATATAEFIVALNEPSSMDIAIETDRALAGASISILLSGGVELDGYGSRRELTWTTDLDAGINRLSLPVLAIDPAGGQMVVRLSHPDSEQMFVVQLKIEG